MKAGTPIQAKGIMPVGQEEISDIPHIAFSIPDFEGQAILRVFSNTTQSQIGCYSSVVTNGATFSHPAAVGSVLGIFAIIALFSSIAVAIYGSNVSSIRKHYAHSLSVFVAFSTLQHIYITGALPMNWPSVLTAFWSNYAWAAGMIYNENMQASINQITGNNGGSGTSVGSTSESTGGGYNASRIYPRDPSSQFLSSEMRKQWSLSRRTGALLQARANMNASASSSWYGAPVDPGLPLPGNYSGFSGTLSLERIPVSNAFMTGFLWLLIILAIISASMIVLKWTIEGLCYIKIVKTERLAQFRSHWLRYTWMIALRTLFVAFFMLQFLSIFQFTLNGGPRVSAIAALVFIISLLGMFVTSGIALYQRLRQGHFVVEPERLILTQTKLLGAVPWLTLRLETKSTELARPILSLPWWRVQHINRISGQVSVHDDEDYMKKFAWLTCRFRRSRWWFFSVWLVYEFVRACFFGAGFEDPISQIIGLTITEFIALIVIAWMKPFEATRLNALMVYCLGFSKITTVALSSAFDPRFNLGRITSTVIGIVIIVIQSILTVLLLIAIVVGAASSYVSITRHRSDVAFKPHSWLPLRIKYLAHIDQRALDLPPPPPESTTSFDVELQEPSFNVTSVRRFPKIEDEMPQTGLSNIQNHNGSNASIPYREPTARAALAAVRSRAQSVQSGRGYYNIPYGARLGPGSWSSREPIIRTEERRANQGTSMSSASNSSIVPPIPQAYSPVSRKQ